MAARNSPECIPGGWHEEFLATVQLRIPEKSATVWLAAVSVRNLVKHYHLGSEVVQALRGVSFDVQEGEYVAIMGPSGSGKSTLLNLLGCLDRPTSGTILLGDVDVSRLNDDQRSEIRARKIGFIFQSYNLIPQLTVLENIEVPLYYQGRISAAARRRCRELAEMVGLKDRLRHRPPQLSGGQQQRVAIARSLVNDPVYILADEPTGNLDSATAEEILELLESLNAAGKTVIMVTARAGRGSPLPPCHPPA